MLLLSALFDFRFVSIFILMAVVLFHFLGKDLVDRVGQEGLFPWLKESGCGGIVPES